MKYIDSEKLKAKIEKRMNILDIDSPFGIGGRVELELVLDTITSLQQEPPEVDIWKEIHKYFNPHGMELQFDRSKGNTILKPEQLIKFARHFAEWGATHLNARKEESK